MDRKKKWHKDTEHERVNFLCQVMFRVHFIPGAASIRKPTNSSQQATTTSNMQQPRKRSWQHHDEAHPSAVAEEPKVVLQHGHRSTSQQKRRRKKKRQRQLGEEDVAVGEEGLPPPVHRHNIEALPQCSVCFVGKKKEPCCIRLSFHSSHSNPLTRSLAKTAN